MLNITPQNQQDIDLPPLSRVAGLPSRPSAEALPSIPGYRIICSLGAGAMGNVWRAFQISTRREVALKLMSASEIGSGKARQRFEREVELTSQLEHPGIARLYESGVHQNIYYYAMELIEGKHLDSHIKSNSLSQVQILKLFHAICQALQHAHEHGVIHRDLKPSNILVDAKGQPRVVDFGLAKQENVALDASLISLNGDIAGTPAFMSPEQAAGKTDGLDTRSDVYSLGVILYLLLTRKYPVDTSGSYVEVLYRVMNIDVTPPRQISKAITPDLQKIILKAISRLPQDRYSNAGAFASDIENYLNGEPVAAQAPTLAYVLTKKLRKHRISTAVSASAVFAFSAIVIYASVRISGEKDLAVAAAIKAERATERSDLRLADMSLQSADQSIAEGRWLIAQPQLIQANEIYSRYQKPTFVTQLSLLDCALHSPIPLTHFESGQNPFVGLFVAPNSKTALTVTLNGTVSQISLPSGLELASRLSPAGVLMNAIPLDGHHAVALALTDDSTPNKGERSTLSLRHLDEESEDLTLPLPGALHAPVVISPHARYFAAICMARIGTGAAQQHLFVGYLSEKRDSRLVNSDAASVRTMDFSLDEQYLFTGESGGKIKRLNLENFTSIEMMNDSIAHVCKIVCLSGNNILLAQADGSFSQWDFNRGQLIRTFIASGPQIVSLVRTLDADLVAAGDDSGTIRIWNTSTGSLVGCFEHGHRSITSLNFSPDGRTLSSTASDGSVLIWPVPGRYGTVALDLHSVVTDISISSHHRLALIGLLDGTAVVADTRGGKVLCTLGSSGDPVCSVAFAADASRAVVAHVNGKISTFNLPSAQITDLLPDTKPAQPIPNRIHKLRTSMASSLSPDASASLDLTSSDVTLRDITTGSSHTVIDHSMTLGGFSNNGIWAFAANANGQFETIRVHDSITSIVSTNTQPPTCGAVSSQGNLALLGTSDGSLILLDLQARKQLWSSNLQAGGIRNISFCGGDHAALIAIENGSLQLWDLDNQRLFSQIQGDSFEVSFAKISPDERVVVVYGAEHGVRFWNLDIADATVLPSESVADTPPLPHKNPGEKKMRQQALTFARCGFDKWAIEAFQKLPANSIDPCTMGTCYWRLGDVSAAKTEFQKLKSESVATEDQVYADLCIHALENVSATSFVNGKP